MLNYWNFKLFIIDSSITLDNMLLPVSPNSWNAEVLKKYLLNYEWKNEWSNGSKGNIKYVNKL